LHVVPLTMPPLRERKVDIPLLIGAFLKDAALENGKPIRPLSPEATHRLQEYDWPGNVRELRTAIEHGVVMATGTDITLGDLPASVKNGQFSSTPISHLQIPHQQQDHALNLRDSETSLILRALEDARGNRSKAATLLGISRRTLHRRLRELNIFKRQSR
jgi:two-component system, NtrC family, response regulator AtoC